MSERRETKLIERFEAIGSDGRTYALEEYRQYIYTTMLDDTTQRTEGLRSYKVAGGGHVNKHGENDFEIVASGVKLRRK